MNYYNPSDLLKNKRVFGQLIHNNQKYLIEDNCKKTRSKSVSLQIENNLITHYTKR